MNAIIEVLCGNLFFLPFGRKMSEEVIYGEGKLDDVYVEVAMQYNDTYTPNIYSFCNNISTTDHGTHEEGFRLALTRTINKYAQSIITSTFRWSSISRISS